jgi:hypothetical protein
MTLMRLGKVGRIPTRNTEPVTKTSTSFLSHIGRLSPVIILAFVSNALITDLGKAMNLV